MCPVRPQRASFSFVFDSAYQLMLSRDLIFYQAFVISNNIDFQDTTLPRSV